jgi:hypothetical protein
MLDLLFDKTEHNSYFGKMNFGSKEKFKTATNSSLYLLILTWLRQLEQYFYNFDGNDDFEGDWNEHGKYYATTSMMKSAPLANIHMANEDEILTNITDVSFFEPTHRDGVCVSLEEWGARIFKPHDKQVLRDAKRGCEKTKERFNRANNASEEFSFTTTDLSSSKHNDEGQEREDAEMAYDISPDRHKDRTKEMLLYNISRGIQLLLNKSEPKINTKKKEMKKGEEDDNVIATTAASSLLALVNGLDSKSNKFNQLDKMQNHMSNLITAQNEKKTGKNNNKQDSEKKKTDSGEDSSSSSEYKKKTPRKGLRKQTFHSTSSDSDSD